MSSFKRRGSNKQSALPAGTRILPGSSSNYITSTGIPSLDDILGGGLPLTCSQLILAPDAHSEYGQLVQKYFIAQGLVAGQDVCVVGDEARQFTEECMWVPGSAALVSSTSAEDEDDESGKNYDEKIKIAWRYEHMKQFQTTVSASNQVTDDYCQVFDLTCRIPSSVIEASTAKSQLAFLGVSDLHSAERTIHRVLRQLGELLGPSEVDAVTRKPLRICIPFLGSPEWADLEASDVCYFLYSLRALLKKHTHACVSISLATYMCAESWSGTGWTQKLGWLSDACISLSAFTANPSLSSLFPSHHGFVHIHSLPAPSTLLPPSNKFSTLRGLTSSGENNLAFKCMRKRLIFETLHLDVEGGVGERRTTPSANTVVHDAGVHVDHQHGADHSHNEPHGGLAAVEVELERVSVIERKTVGVQPSAEIATATSPKKPKQKRKVAFASDRPDLYDF